MTRTSALAVLIVVALNHSCTTNRSGNPPLDVKIVPVLGPWNPDEIHLDEAAGHFHVVITNLSEEPQRIWKDWNSWGYYALSFEVVSDDGSVVRVRRAPRSWIANSPDPVTLVPKSVAVLDVSFDPAEWENSPLPGKGERTRVRMAAIYEGADTREAAELGVWRGVIRSSQATYSIVR